MAKIKITFLGTGPSGRIPRPGCTRPSCRDARRKGSRSRRLQQSLLMSSGGTTLLFDISQDVHKQWRHAGGIRRVDAAFISHPHQDAYGGLSRIRDILRRIRQPSLTVHAERAVWERAGEDFGPLEHLEKRVMVLRKPVRVGPFTVRPFRVQHAPNATTHPTAGFSIVSGGRQIVLMTDVKRVPSSSYGVIGKPHLLIMDCAIYDREFPSHVNLAEALDVIGRIRPRKTVLTQIGVSWPPYFQAKRIATGHGLDMAYDGRVLTL